MTVPAIQLALFGYAVSLDPRAVPIAVAGDRADSAGRLHRAIDSTGSFSIGADGLAPGAAEQMVRDGKALVGIEWPSEGGSRAASSPPRVVVNAVDPGAVRPALAALETAY